MSPGGLVTLIREFCSQFSVLVPNRAFSAATLTALGADEIVMHPMGMLGPTDPTVANDFNPPNPNAPNQLLGISVSLVALDTVKLVYVESMARCDVFESDYEVGLHRDFMGSYGAQVSIMRQEWVAEAEAPEMAQRAADSS